MELKPIIAGGEVRFWVLVEDDKDAVIMTIVRVHNELRVVVAPDYTIDLQVETEKKLIRTGFYGP